jgi:DTW domain-containing protein
VRGGRTPPTPTLPRSRGDRRSPLPHQAKQSFAESKGGGSKREPASSISSASLPSPSPFAGPSTSAQEGRGGGNLSAAQTCPHCRKPAALCVCAAIHPIETRAELVILQHPQEQGHALGTAYLAHRQFANSRLVIGLSWPSLAAALGRPSAEPRRWGVLYLGPHKPGAVARVLGVVDAEGTALADQDLLLAALEGIILLDGSWSQAKALWWRNPWLLKLRRLVLAPPRPSRYGELRKEPRPDSVSTIEAAAFALAAIEGDATIAERGLAPLVRLIALSGSGKAPRARDRRRRKGR